MYSEKSKIVVCLDSFSKQIYNIWVFLDLHQSLRHILKNVICLDACILNMFSCYSYMFLLF